MSTTIRSFADCVSEQERQQRWSVNLVNGLLWFLFVLTVVGSLGMILLPTALGWLVNRMMAEYNVRKIQALGATVSPEQFPEVAAALEDVCQRFGVANNFRVIVLASGEANALSLRFARKRVVVLLSELLAGIIDDQAELRALLAHELCHAALDHGWRGTFEVYKPARYRQGRELTCDNAGLVAAGDLDAGLAVIRKLCVGRHLHDRLSERALIAESRQIYSGFAGWLLRQYLTHPPAGSRVENLALFASRLGLPPAGQAPPAPADSRIAARS